MISITFDNPDYLWFLFAVPLMVITHFFLLRHAKRRAMKFANFVVLKRVTGQRLITKNYLPLVLRVLILICAVLAIAQTNVWYEGETNQDEYILAIDTSASMTAQDFDPTRLDVARMYAVQFTDALDPNTRAGIVSFSGITLVEQPLTTDRGDLKEALEGLEVVASGTDIPGAIITSTNLLLAAERGRTIILITDGSNTVEDFHSRSILRAVNYAKGNRIKVHTIGVGKDIRTPLGYLPQYYNVSTTYNADNLVFIANATGGNYYAAENNEELVNAYNDIKSNTQQSKLSRDLTGGLMLVALLLLLAEWGLTNTRYRMLP